MLTERYAEEDKMSEIVESRTTTRQEPVFIADNLTISLKQYYIPAHYEDYLDHIMIPNGLILDRVEKLAYDILQDYKGKTIHLLCVLKGGSQYFQDLTNALRKFHAYSRAKEIPFTFDFIRVKSYEGTEQSGKVQITGCDVNSLKGKHVLFVEDIIDTGVTMAKLFEYLNSDIKPASVGVTALVEKRTDRSNGFKANYVGYSIPDKFVVGYCMDYNEAYRDLNHLCVINERGIGRFQTEEHR